MKPTALLTSCWHLRESQPTCRTDDFWEAQWRKVKFIKELQDEYSGCPILNSGDLFHHWKPSPRLISYCIDYLPFMYIIPGNHDLPNHNLGLLEKSGLWTLEKAGKIKILQTELGKAWCLGENEWSEVDGDTDFKGKSITIIHKLINHPQSSTTAKQLMNQLKGYDLILTGDNHQSFFVGYQYEKDKDTLLINPGSLTRQTADQDKHVPTVFLWYAETNEFDTVPIPIEKDVISRDHLVKAEERDERMEAFVDRLDDDYEIELSFKKNLKSYFNSNRTHRAVKEMVWESAEGV